ncbi:MAG: NAD(P)H-binding protein [Myxococcota bacterium]
MRVLVAGGTSTVGRFLVERLRSDGHEVDVLSRGGPVAGDVTRPETLRGVCDGRDAVVSLVGASVNPAPRFPEQTFEAVDRDGNLALLAEAERAGVGRFVYLSVFGEYPPGVAYVEAHRAVDAALERSPLSTTSIRPTGFFGSFAALRPAARLGLAVRIGSGECRTNPIHEADLADVIADHLVDGPAVVDCGGPEVLTRNEIGARLGGKPVWNLPVPGALVGLSALTTRPLAKRVSDLTVFFRHVLTHDGVAPAYGTRRLGP